MSNKTLVRGISAAAILAILTGAAYGEVTTPNYSTGFDGTGTTHAASTILGGTVFNFNGSSGDWSAAPTYVLVRSTTDNKAVTLAGDVSPYKEGSIAGSGSFSFHTVAQMSEATSPKVVASVGDSSWDGGKTGLTLVYHDGNIKLVSWKKGTGSTVIIDAAVTGAETAYHSYLVTLNKSTEEGVASTAKVFVDGVQVGETTAVTYEPGVGGYQLGGVYGGTGNVSVGDTACVKGAGILVDDAAIWQSDVSAEAAEIAAKFPVWSATVSEITLPTGDVNWSDVKPESMGDTLTITLEGDTNLTLGESVSFGNLIVKGAGTLLITDPSNCTVANFTKEGSADFGYVIDATAGVTADDTIKGYIRNTNYKLVIKGAGEGETATGLTVDFGTTANFVINSHLIFDGGKHTFKYGRGASGDFGGGASDANPTILVKDSTTLDLVGKDLTAWDGAYNASGVIRVNDGGTLNFQSYDGNTIYYRQRLVIDPGATVTAPTDGKFRLYGGASSDTIVVPANGGEKVATFTGTIGMYKDGTPGVGINVGSGSKLQFNGKILQGNDKNYQFAKRGDGTISGLQIDGNTTITTLWNADGLTILSGTTTLQQTHNSTSNYGNTRGLIGTTTVASGATLKLACNDAINYSGTTTTDVKGTLDLGVNRQTVFSTNTIKIHPGAVITGTMPAEADGDTPAVTVDGGCHLNQFQNSSIQMVSENGDTGTEATISAIIGPQGTPIFAFNVAQGLTLNLTTPSSSTGSGRTQGINKVGAGTLKIAETADISTLAALKVSAGVITVVEGASIPTSGVTCGDSSKQLVTEEGEGFTTYKAVPTYTVTIGTSSDERVKAQYKIGDGDWIDYSEPVVVLDDASLYFQYVSVDPSQWTVEYSVSGLQYTHIHGNKSYTFDESKLTVTPVTSPTVPEAIEGGSEAQQTAYAEWATENGVSGLTTAKLADAFAIGATGTDEATVLAAAETKLETTLLAKIDLDALAGEGGVEAAVAALNAEYGNAKFTLVEVEEIETTANLFRLKVEFRPANSQN